MPSSAKVGIGVGAAGFMVGGVTGILSLITKKPADPRCAASQCPPSTWNDYDPSTKALIRTSTASMIIGVAGVGLAVGSILLHRKHEPAPSAARALAESVKITPAAGGMALVRVSSNAGQAKNRRSRRHWDYWFDHRRS